MIKSISAIIYLTLSFSLPAWAQTSKEFELKSNSWIKCQPEDSSPQNLFNCCIHRARAIQVDDIKKLETESTNQILDILCPALRLSNR
jgi:hypothetical protein